MANHLRQALVDLVETNKHGFIIVEQLRSFETLAIIRAGALLTFNGLTLGCVFTLLAEQRYDMPEIFIGCFAASIGAIFLSLVAILARGRYAGLKTTDEFLSRWDWIIKFRNMIINFATVLSLFSVGLTVLMFIEVMQQSIRGS